MKNIIEFFCTEKRNFTLLEWVELYFNYIIIKVTDGLKPFIGLKIIHEISVVCLNNIEQICIRKTK